MQKLAYPLIVSDFDGTLVQSDATISQENKQAIERYEKDGGVFAISTGRMPGGIMPRVKELGLKGIVSCCQGAIIMDIESQQTLLDESLSYETTIAIAEKMEAMGLHIHLYDKWAYYSNKDDELLKWYIKAVKIPPTIIKEGGVVDFIKENHFCTYKVVAMVMPGESQAVIEELKKANFAGCTVTKSGEVLVEVINEKYSKGTAVAHLAKYYDLPLEKVIAVGDQWNDLSMIERAGMGIAVKNADELLKAAANYVCEYTNDESAIAKILEKFVYKESL